MLNYDDYMFPLSLKAKRQSGLVCESCENPDGSCGQDGEQKTHDKEKAASVLEGAGSGRSIEDIVLEAAETDLRAMAATIALEWAQGDDHSYDALDAYVLDAAGIDEDSEVTEDDEDFYNEVWGEVADALVFLGADETAVTELCDKEDSSAGASVAEAVKSGLVAEGAPSDDAIVMEFAAGDNYDVFKSIYEGVEGGLFEASYRKKKVVRTVDGKPTVVRINRRVSGKVRLSAAQKAGLRAARRKAFTAAARLHRRKSMKLRKQRGL